MNNYVFLVGNDSTSNATMTALGATSVKTYTQHTLWYLSATSNPFDADTPPNAALYASLLLPNPL